jgi:hypothetical protein
VAALVMTALFQLLSRDMQGAARIDDYTRATLAAEAKLEGLGISEPLVPGTANGRIDERFAWRIKVDPLGTSRRTGSSDLPVSLYRVLVTVSWDGGAEVRSVSLEGLRLQ